MQIKERHLLLRQNTLPDTFSPAETKNAIDLWGKRIEQMTRMFKTRVPLAAAQESRVRGIKAMIGRERERKRQRQRERERERERGRERGRSFIMREKRRVIA